jgi:hypothetical protein
MTASGLSSIGFTETEGVTFGAGNPAADIRSRIANAVQVSRAGIKLAERASNLM